MQRLDVTDELIWNLIGEMAPLVENATGWPLALDVLRSRVLPRDQGYEEILLGRLRGAGIDLPDEGHRGLLERLLEYVVEGSFAAAYQPHREELVVVRENVDDSNLDGLRLVVAHELVHRGQHVRYPHLFERVDEKLRDVFDSVARGAVSFRELQAEFDAIRPLMTLVESHATYVQEGLRRTRYPDAVIETHFNLPVLLFRLFGGKKIKQYQDGIPQVADAAACGDVDALYLDL